MEKLRVRSGIELDYDYRVQLSDKESLYAAWKAGFRVVSDTPIAYGDVVDAIIDKEHRTVVLRLVDDGVGAGVADWITSVSGKYVVDNDCFIIAEGNDQTLMVVPVGTTITHSHGGLTHLSEERVYIPADLAPAWRLLRGK